MAAQPSIQSRAAQPYVGIPSTVTMDQIGEVLPALHPEVFGWLEAHGIAPAGPPLWKYNLISMEAAMEIEVAVPTAELAAADQRIQAGEIPAGRYATVVHVGHPAELMQATADLLAWAEEQGLQFDMAPEGRGERWAARLEEYLTDPAEEPDMSRWETRLAFRLAGPLK
jgi:effector-binding domain-containing protein